MEEINWLGLEPMHITTKLIIFPNVALQEE
jgi:hypothetical protein